MTIRIQDIYKAAQAIAGIVVKTPCVQSRTLSEIIGAHVILKFENHQFTASFKDRGALVKLLTLSSKQRIAGVVAMSAGNHAQAVAYHSQRLGIPVTIVMPRTTPNVKVERTQAFGAKVILHGNRLEEAFEFAKEHTRKQGLQLIHPYDDKHIIAGQGTIAIEMLETFPDIDLLIIPIGGGGLIAGNAIAAKAIRPEIKIIGVQSARFPSMLKIFKGETVYCETSTIAEGIAVKEPGCLTLPIVQEFVDDILTAEEEEIEDAVLLLLNVEKTVVEGAGAAGLAALLKDPKRFKGKKVGLILSGGNIDLFILSSIIQRGLVHSGRLVRLNVGIPDTPGALAEITRLLGENNANIIEVRHQRAFTNLSLQLAEVEFVLQTLGTDHVLNILEIIRSASYEASLLDIEAIES
ncbi:MAG: threonine ammonia-lyase [Thermodesulfobacteriota bacterium]|nr:threonine ammonia-lyase [Thermodesulfobacteriota bacterium]